MGALSRETQIVQNPALGAMLLWRFASGFESGSRVSMPAPIPLLFIVLPITLHHETAELIASTRQASGLRSFIGKFSESRISKNDLILALNERAIRMRKLSMESLNLAISSSLIALDTERGLAIALSLTEPKTGVPKPVRTMLQCAERLGYWCSEVSLHEVSAILKVRF